MKFEIIDSDELMSTEISCPLLIVQTSLKALDCGLESPPLVLLRWIWHHE